MNLTVCPLCWPGLIPGHGGVFQGIFPWLIMLCQPVLSQQWQKMTEKVLRHADSDEPNIASSSII